MGIAKPIAIEQKSMGIAEFIVGPAEAGSIHPRR
jgi:hypothetical protein